jgi:acyloxyacyl hydrolase
MAISNTTVLLVLAMLAGASGFKLMEFKPSSLKDNVNGGSPCAVCTIVIALIEQTSEINNVNASKGLAEICTLLPANLSKECTKLVDLLGPRTFHISSSFGPSSPTLCLANRNLCMD